MFRPHVSFSVFHKFSPDSVLNKSHKRFISNILQKQIISRNIISTELERKYLYKSRTCSLNTETKSVEAGSVPSHWTRNLLIQEPSVKDKSVTFELPVEVIDTFQNSTDRPTIVGIHGIPGEGDSFQPLISELHDRGIRFVAPTFPGFGVIDIKASEIKHLDFSTEGRHAVFKKILKEADVTRIDLLLSHSGGCWLGYKVAADIDQVKAAMFLNPVGRKPHVTLRPHWFIKAYTAAMRLKPLHPYLLRSLENMYKKAGFRVAGGQHLQVSMETLSACGLDKMYDYADKISLKRIPVVFAHTRTDRIVEWEVVCDMMKCMNIPENSVIVYDDNKIPSWDPFLVNPDNWLARGFLFPKGGHQVHRANAEEILAQILDVLQLVQRGA